MDRLNGTEAKSRRESFARLKHDCMAIGLWINNEDITMNLQELKNMSSKELTALYNEHAAKQVKRMESRAKLEERTAQLLREAGKLDETQAAENAVSSPSPVKGKKATAAKPPIEAPNPAEEGNADMATAATKKTAAKKATKTVAKKATKTAAPAAKKDAGNAKRGAPLTDHNYIAISEKSKDFNPRGYKPQAESMRNKVYLEIKNSDGGKTRTQLEKKFSELGSVKAQLDVLVKLQFIKTA